jgi:hypothetical protein
MGRIVLACPALQHFSILSQKRQDFRVKGIDNKSILIFSTTLSKTFLILRRNERDIIKNVYLSSCKFPLLLVKVLKKLEFSRHIFEKC